MMEEIDDHSIIFLDKQGNIETWNRGAEKIKGYTTEEIIGKNFNLFYGDTDRQQNLPARLLHEASAKGKTYHEGWRQRQNNSQFWGATTITALHSEQGEVMGFVKITRDLTDRMQAETTIKAHAQHLEMKNKELEQFVYIASHDLQEPLLNMSNFVELLQLEYAPQLDETASLYLDVIQQSTERMRSLIKGLLDYSRLGKEKTLSTIDCHQLIETLKEDLTASLTAAGAELVYTDLPVVSAYTIELRQLFQNLISNAIKFKKADTLPLIRIWAEKLNGHWRFAINDNGIGIDPAYHDKIFLIFKRLHDREVYEGNGIGLAHCKKIVEMHGGDLTVESVPGEGSTFFFTIPDHN
jgi:PAS domain S-box-containing protein